MLIYSFSGSSFHIQKILKSTEKQESEKRIKMQQEVVEVLETNAKSKKCNPVEAGLYKFKTWKLDSGIFFTVGAFSLRSHPPCLLTLILKWRTESNSEKQRGYWRINTLNLCKALPLLYLVRCCGCSG